MKTTLKQKQGMTIAVIVAAGLLLGGLILKSGKAPGNAPAAEMPKAAAAVPHSETEGELDLSDAQLQAAGVTLAVAAPGRIRNSVALPGEIRFNDDRTAHVVPRLAGVVEAVHADLGQLVKKGQVLAVIASTDLSERRSELLSAQRRLALARSTHEREQKLWQEKISAEQDYLQARQLLQEAEIAVQNASQKLAALGAGAGDPKALSRYEIRAPFAGMVLEKHVTLGEAVKEDANIFIISDLSTVWADIAVPAKDLSTVRVGAKALVKAAAFDTSAAGTITYVGALIGEQTRTAKARITLANPDLAWRPGLFVSVEVASGQSDAKVAVASSALQEIEGKPSVFIKTGHGVKAVPVRVGRSDATLTEIIDGLAPGARYAAGGSFVLKSELGKAGAGHEH